MLSKGKKEDKNNFKYTTQPFCVKIFPCMKSVCINRLVKFFFFSFLLCFITTPAWVAEPDLSQDLGLHADALFDRARSTSSLRDYYRMRLDLNEKAGRGAFCLGIEKIGVNNYLVLTEFGVQKFDASIAFSFFRVDIPNTTQNTIFDFRGIDLSGKSVVIGKSFTINGEGFFDPYSRVFQEDLCVFLFSVFNFSLDLGFLRSRVMNDIDATGIRSEDISDSFVRFVTSHEADEYAFYCNNTVISGFDINMILGNLFKSISPRIDIPAVLRFANLYPSGGIAPYIQKATVYGTFSNNTASAGFELEISNLGPKNYCNTDKNGIFGVGVSYKFEHEFLRNDYSLFCSEVTIGIFPLYLFAAGSFITDPLLEPFGASAQGVWGWRAGVLISFRSMLDISFSNAFNFVDDIQFMTGSYSHSVTRMAISLRF